MKCPRCGARIRDDAAECPACGIWLDDLPETAEPSNKPLLIAMALVLTALLVITFLAFTGKFSEQRKAALAAATPTPEAEETAAVTAAPAPSSVPTPLSTEPLSFDPSAQPTASPSPSASAAPEPTPTPNSTALQGHYVIPGSDSRYLTETELADLSDRDLMLARNEIFARHGFIFSTDWLQGYFLTQSWYKGTATAAQFDADVFNAFERANVDLILRVEAEREGG